MGDLPRRSFLGFLAALPFVGKLVPAAKAESGLTARPLVRAVHRVNANLPSKLTALMFNPECYIADRGAWLRRILRIDKPVDVLFHVTMPCCGYQVSYPTLESLPHETMPCPCGRKDYNVVQWPARPAVCKRCAGHEVIGVDHHEPVTDPAKPPYISRTRTVWIPCPECQQKRLYNTADECGCFDGSCSTCVAKPMDLHWDTSSGDLWRRPKGGATWSKIGRA